VDWFSAWNWVTSFSVIFGCLATGALIVIVERRRRRQQRQRARRWHYEYFHKGGLIAALMARWKPLGRLTDQRQRDSARPNSFSEKPPIA